MAYIDLYSELTGEVPGLSGILARKFINRALEQVYGERNWSFNVLDGSIVCPAQIIAGAVTFVQFASTVLLDTDASAALLPQTVTGATPGVQQLSIRFSGAGVVGQIYNIISADTTTPTAIVLTLNRAIVDASGTGSAYQIYRPYIVPPLADFLAWESVVDMANGYTLWGQRISRTSAEFDARDPQRQSQGLAYWMGSYAGGYVNNVVTGAVVPNATMTPGDNLYELWPHPTSGQTFYCRFRRKGALFLNPTDQQAAAISDDLLLHRARGWSAYPWANANKGNFPSLKGTDWVTAAAAEKAAYDRDLRDAKKNDDEQALQTVWNRGHGLRAPRWNFKGGNALVIDSEWLATHLVNF